MAPPRAIRRPDEFVVFPPLPPDFRMALQREWIGVVFDAPFEFGEPRIEGEARFGYTSPGEHRARTDSCCGKPNWRLSRARATNGQVMNQPDGRDTARAGDVILFVTGDSPRSTRAWSYAAIGARADG